MPPRGSTGGQPLVGSRSLPPWRYRSADVWQQRPEALLTELGAASPLDWSRSAVDSSHVRALADGQRHGEISD